MCIYAMTSIESLYARQDCFIRTAGSRASIGEGRTEEPLGQVSIMLMVLVFLDDEQY